MSDEQTIFISPEDDLTTVRERLEQVPVQNVMLVIPSQTLLRSHVAWRNLHMRARELGKDVLIISPDAQIRSVAQAAKFRVARSLGSSPTDRTRTPSRSDRSGHGSPTAQGRTTTSSSTRSSSTRSGLETRGANGQRTRVPRQATRGNGQAGQAPRRSSGLSGLSARSASGDDFANDEPTITNITRETLNEPVSHTFEEPGPEYGYDQLQSQGHAYNYNRPASLRDTPPSILPLSPIQPEEPIEESDWLSHDYPRAIEIREAATQSNPPIESDVSSTLQFPPSQPGQEFAGRNESGGNEAERNELGPYGPVQEAPHEAEDPFATMEDFTRPPLPEQRAAAMVDSVGADEPAIQEDVTGLSADAGGAIEYQREQGGLILPPNAPVPFAPLSISDPIPEDEQDTAGPARAYGARRGRTGRNSIQRTPLDIESEDALPPVEDVPTRSLPNSSPTPPRMSQPLSPKTSQPLQPRTSQPLSPRTSQPIQNPARPQQARPRSKDLASASPASPSSRAAQPGRSQRSRTDLSRPAPEPDPISRRGASRVGSRAGAAAAGAAAGVGAAAKMRSASPQSPKSPRSPQSPQPATARRSAAQAPRPSRKNSVANLLLLVAVVLLVLLLGGIAYFGPSADVTVTLFSRDFSAPVQFTASTQKQVGTANVYPAVLLTKEFSQSGTGKATGNVKVGTAKATGSVIFTNIGKTPVDIPTGVVVTTSNNVQFATAADAVVNVQSSAPGNSIQIPVQAQQSGEIGNVPSGSITNIPVDSLNVIARNNNVAASSLQLQVTNMNATAGGGVGNATAVSRADIDNERGAIRALVDTSVTNWLKSQLGSGDVAGNPEKTETVASAPVENQVVDNGTFDMRLDVAVKVPVVRYATIQQASIGQLNDALRKSKAESGYAILPDANIAVSGLKSNGDVNALTLNFSATGKAAPDISKQQVQDLIKGRSKSDAESLLKSNVSGVEYVAIKVSPSFINRVPLWPGHINVTILSGSVQPVPTPNNNKP